MPPNSVVVAVMPEPQMMMMDEKKFDPSSKPTSNYKMQIFQASVNLLAHVLIGSVVGISIAFAFRTGLPLNATRIHIIMCVVGYKLLMAEAVLSLAPENGWSAKLTLVHKRRAHWILQLAGSVLAIVGSFIKILDKDIHWNSLHGQFALVALVFTSVSLFNGLSSLYAYELRKVMPGMLSKLTHICFGTVAFSAATICLCYGFDKNSFRNWATSGMADATIALTVVLSFIVIFSPLLNFGKKSLLVISK